MTGMAIVVTFVLLLVVGEMINRNADEKKTIILNDYGYYIQNEFILAAETEPGYKRIIDIPNELENIEYSIWNTDKILFVNSSKIEFWWHIPETQGNVQKGINIIQNINGSVCINC